MEVHYTMREFITWWLEELAKRPTWKSPTCGRKDHADHYRFGNIELVERSENSREMNQRIPHHMRVRPVELRSPRGTCMKFSSIGEASRITGIPRSLIQMELDGKIKRPGQKFGFKYTQK